MSGTAVVAAVLVALALWPAGAGADQHERTAEPPEPRPLALACPAEDVPDAGFTDVAPEAVHAGAVDCAAWYGVAHGGPGARPSDEFGPQLGVRRDQMASFIARFVDYADEQTEEELLAEWDGHNRFDDVAAGTPHVAAVNRLAEAGIVAGGPGGRPASEYGPAQTVRRDQMASFITRSLDVILPESLTTDEVYFDDLAGVAPEHAANINVLAEERVVAGRQVDGQWRYAPGQSVRRDQMTSFVMRAMDLLVDRHVVAPRQPGPAVAVTAEGRVVVLDTATGEEVRELMAGVPTDDPAKNDVAVTPDQRDAYVAVPAQETGGDTDIFRVPVAGGEPEAVVGDGSSPAVSPDGSTLAYAVHAGEGPGDPDPRVVLRNLATGDEVRLSGTDEPLHFISDLGWTADGSEVVFTAGEINTGVYAIDRNATSMEQARRLGPGAQQGSDLSWRSTAAFGDRLAVVEMCCDIGFAERWHIISVDPADGSVAGRLVPEERIAATHVDSDADANELLIVENGGPGGGTLLRWHGTGSPQAVTDGVIVAAW